MSFNVEKVKTYGVNPKAPARGSFNINKVQTYNQPKPVITEPLNVQSALSSVKQRRFDETSVRVPFRQEKAQLNGPINGGLTRFAANMLYRGVEDIVIGGTKVAATVKGENVSLPFKITHEPTITGGEPVTQQDFEPMSSAALKRINQLDSERPDKRTLNLLQGTAEEVFLPILNAVDIVGLGSLTTRLARKLTFSKEATQALDNLGIGFLDDTSEEGIKRSYSEQVQKNINLLATEKVTPKEFVKKMDEIGASLDSLAPDKTTTRFGKAGERINRIATALEAERKISRAVDLKVANAPALARNATRNAERTRLTVKSDGSGARAIPMEVEAQYKATLDQLKDYESRLTAISGAERGEILVKNNADGTFGGFVGKGSTFPSYVDEDLRSRKLFDKYLDGRDGTANDFNIKYKEGSRLDRLDKIIKKQVGVEETKISKNVKFAEAAKAKIDNAVAQKTTTQTANNIKFAETAQAKIDDAVAKKTTTDTPTTKETVKETPTKEPAKETKQKVSKLATRINEGLPEGQKISEFYDVKVIKEELETAAKEIEKDATKALADAMDGGQTLTSRAAKLMEFAQNAKEKGDIATQTALLSKMRVLGTEVAQGLNMFKAYGFSNPETEFMYKIVEARLSKISISAEDIAKAGSRNKAYNDKVYAPVKKEVTRKMREAVNIKAAQDLFDELMC